MKENIYGYQSSVTQQQRQAMMKQRGLVVWLTGLSGAGKSTISLSLERALTDEGYFVYCLDGDNLRLGLNHNLGFSREDREENIRRIAHVAALFCDACFITVVSCISPLRSMRKMAREIIGDGNFIETYVKADFQECRRRDPKGLYRKAHQGELANFTGVGAAYEIPENPELVLDTEELPVDECIKLLSKNIKKRLER